MKRSRSVSKDAGSFKGADRLFNNQREKIKRKQEILEGGCFSTVLNYENLCSTLTGVVDISASTRTKPFLAEIP